MRPALWLLATLVILLAPHLIHADSILVGSDLSHATNGGAVLCPGPGNCSVEAQQFTLFEDTRISAVKVSLSGPFNMIDINGQFTLLLTTSLSQGGPAWAIGSGAVTFRPDGTLSSEIFDFESLDLPANAGTYYLQLLGGYSIYPGGNLEWNYAPELSSSLGSVGFEAYCDPFLSCRPGVGISSTAHRTHRTNPVRSRSTAQSCPNLPACSW